jgi:hypothetical protein
MPSRLSLLSIALLIGCGHTDPFSNPDSNTGQPFDPSPPARLTLNLGLDRDPAWLADGSGILYSAQDPGRSDRDVCLALLPPAGGQQSELWCDVPGGADRSDAIWSAGPGPDGRLAFLAVSTTRGNSVPERLGIRVAPGIDPAGGTEVRQLPYLRGASVVNSTGRLRWAGADRLAYLGLRSKVRVLCPTPFSCDLVDTLVAGIDVEVLELGAAAAPAPVPGTEHATGLATLADGTEILYTLADDSRIYRRNLSSGAVSVAHDFGSAGVVRDLDAAGSLVVAVVGGVVGQAVDPDLGPFQWDSGGTIHLVDLSGNSDTPLATAGRLYRRPALSPAGDQVVAEGHPFVVQLTPDPVTQEPVVDTVVTPTADLFLFRR